MQHHHHHQQLAQHGPVWVWLSDHYYFHFHRQSSAAATATTKRTIAAAAPLTCGQARRALLAVLWFGILIPQLLFSLTLYSSTWNTAAIAEFLTIIRETVDGAYFLLPRWCLRWKHRLLLLLLLLLQLCITGCNWTFICRLELLASYHFVFWKLIYTMVRKKHLLLFSCETRRKSNQYECKFHTK